MSKIFSSGTLNYRQTKTIRLLLFVMDYEVSHVIGKKESTVVVRLIFLTRIGILPRMNHLH